MTITEVKIRRLYNQERLKALVSVTFDDALVIHDIKIIKGPKRLSIKMKKENKEVSGLIESNWIVCPFCGKKQFPIGNACIEDLRWRCKHKS